MYTADVLVESVCHSALAKLACCYQQQRQCKYLASVENIYNASCERARYKVSNLGMIGWCMKIRFKRSLLNLVRQDQRDLVRNLYKIIQQSQQKRSSILPDKVDDSFLIVYLVKCLSMHTSYKVWSEDAS